MTPILQAGQSYTFRSYFELPFEADEILAELGFTLVRTELEFPRHLGTLDRLPETLRRIQENLRYASLSNEQARRELLVAPVVLDLCHYTQAQLRIEYTLVVSEWLKGSLDYYLKAETNLLVVEAKNDDLVRGFTQLAAELIALDQAGRIDSPVLYGAVTTGDIWRLGKLDRDQKRIEQDLNLYRVPADLEELLRILVALMT
ncbi:MAG: hypothetical protein KME10_09920 [Plectolyngbya sp. WJT66-NPBG17]|jgi:hypothetical protein|nr:hypothetical protein [Plectolyngbya sp. WJT66-NPBG17]MBW4525620.1 hypothetical protein [Phormidium tanganyikae FI6-MK23]